MQNYHGECFRKPGWDNFLLPWGMFLSPPAHGKRCLKRMPSLGDWTFWVPQGPCIGNQTTLVKEHPPLALPGTLGSVPQGLRPVVSGDLFKLFNGLEAKVA